MYSDKPKFKTTAANLPAWLNPLIGPLYLDFVAPCSLETALKILEQQSVGGFFRLTYVDIQLIPQDDDTVNFVLRKWGTTYRRTEAHGFLKRWSQDSTVVQARINIALYHYLFFIPAVAFIGLFFHASFGTDDMLLLMMFAGVFFYGWVAMRHQRYDVARIIKTALLADLEDADLYLYES